MTAKDKQEIWDNMITLDNITDTYIHQHCEHNIYSEMKESINSILKILNEYKAKGSLKCIRLLR